jgi:hypothetical protein
MSRAKGSVWLTALLQFKAQRVLESLYQGFSLKNLQGIRINEDPDGVRLVVGLTATVQIEPRSRRLAN